MNNPVPEAVYSYYEPLVGDTMMELGNKQTSGVSYKSFFQSLGFKHTSIDWNGLDGALKLDLRKPIDLGTFDMVTNIGTTEHVDSQLPVWSNLHCFTKIGGVLLSHTPIKGDWWWHGSHYPVEEFFEQFCENGYEIERMGIIGERPCRTLNVRMRKIEHNPFVMPDESTIYHNRMRHR